MKTKWMFMILAVIMILSIFSVSQGADKFYYGTYNWADITKDFRYIRDSLKCNILWGKCTETTVDSFKNHSLRAIVQNLWGEPDSPSMWAWKSHYTMWEAEGLEQSWVNLQHNGGTEVDDPSASGGKARRFTGPGTPGIIQEGPTYYQEPELPRGNPINYTAEFRLKFWYWLDTPLGPMGPGPPSTVKVCCIMVVDTYNDTILKADTLYKSHFPGGTGGYKTFELEYYVIPEKWNRIEFQIYWFAPPETWQFYIDYVKTYDLYGKELIIDKLHDQEIMDYVSEPWVNTTIPETGETVVYRWYLRDEPGTIDLFATNRYIDSLVRQVSAERVGMQVFNKSQVDTVVHEYFLRQNPEEYHIDLYPVAWWFPHYSGEGFQQGVDFLTKYLNRSKDDADNQQKDFWVTIQTFTGGTEILPGDPPLL
jgi:hypothetical protein